MTPGLSLQELETLEKIPYTLTQRLENRLEEVVSFSGTHQNFCVGIVDMVGSTKVAVPLSKEKVTQYYSIFLNGMAMIVKDHGGLVVKSIGDSLLFYFPKTSDYDPKHFVCPLKCGISMIECSAIINSKMKKDVKTVVVLNEKEACVSFPKLDGDSNITEMFFSSDPIFHEWCLDFFRYNWYGSDIFQERKLID